MEITINDLVQWAAIGVGVTAFVPFITKSIRWKVIQEGRIANLEAYTKRVEVERKEQDDRHDKVFERINTRLDDIQSSLAELNERMAKVEVSLAEHRRECEQRRK